MNNYTLMPLYGYRLKYPGIALSVISVTALFFVNKIYALSLFDGFNKIDYYTLCLLLSGIGLFYIAFSKERNEDERIAIIRDKTFRMSFATVVACFMAITIPQMFLIGDYNSSKMISISKVYAMFMFLLNLCLLNQVVVFYFRIYTNSDMKSYDFTVIENIKNNKTLYSFFGLLYLAGIIILLML
jgi:hypothetical protein